MDLKVIGADGSGLTSHLIAAIDWAIEHKDEYDIRIANLSLGHPAVESYLDDPLCQAVRAMTEAGIVTVVSAGNLGKTESHPKIWGGITSPGIEPSVITVSAVNTRGTFTHSDDVAASFASRGPTIDGFFKPDLTAPGNRVGSLQAGGSVLAEGSLGFSTYTGYLSLSGSSMATAVVAGTAALMLEVNPELRSRGEITYNN